MKTLLLLTTFLVSTTASACSFDTQCSIGSVCLKSAGSIYGVCAGGLNPGNNNDSQPVYKPLETQHTYGNTCNYDSDCGVGHACYKSGGFVRGVCE